MSSISSLVNINIDGYKIDLCRRKWYILPMGFGDLGQLYRIIDNWSQPGFGELTVTYIILNNKFIQPIFIVGARNYNHWYTVANKTGLFSTLMEIKNLERKLTLNQYIQQMSVYKVGWYNGKYWAVKRQENREKAILRKWCWTQCWLRVSQAKNVLGRVNRLYKLPEMEKSLVYLRY